jgi:hypothetical protein
MVEMLLIMSNAVLSVATLATFAIMAHDDNLTIRSLSARMQPKRYSYGRHAHNVIRAAKLGKPDLSEFEPHKHLAGKCGHCVR